MGGKGAALSTLITLFFIYYVYDLFDRDLHRFLFLKFYVLFQLIIENMLIKLKKYLNKTFPLPYLFLVKLKVFYYVLRFKIVYYRNVKIFSMTNSSDQKYYSQHNQGHQYIIHF